MSETKQERGVLLSSTNIADGSGKEGATCVIRPGDLVDTAYLDEEISMIQMRDDDSHPPDNDQGPFTVKQIASWITGQVSLLLENDKYRFRENVIFLKKHIEKM